MEVLRVVGACEGEQFLLGHLPGGGLAGLADPQVLEVAHRWVSGAHWMVRALSMMISVPFTKRDSSEARYTTRFATSSGLPSPQGAAS